MNENKNILDEVFYELYYDGFIYDEDENGHNMSYGEYAAIDNYIGETLEEHLENMSFEEAIEELKYQIETCGDDVTMFFGVEDLRERLSNLGFEELEEEDPERSDEDPERSDEEEHYQYQVYYEDMVPDMLLERWKDFKEEHNVRILVPAWH